MAWTREPWNEAEIARRTGTLDRLERAARRADRDAAPRYDDQGRLILIGYEAVRAFLAQGAPA